MLAVASFPHGFKAVLTDAATLSQAHLIQPGRALGGRTPGKSLHTSSPYGYICDFVSHPTHRLQPPVEVLVPPARFDAGGARWYHGCHKHAGACPGVCPPDLLAQTLVDVGSVVTESCAGHRGGRAKESVLRRSCGHRCSVGRRNDAPCTLPNNLVLAHLW